MRTAAIIGAMVLFLCMLFPGLNVSYAQSSDTEEYLIYFYPGSPPTIDGDTEVVYRFSIIQPDGRPLKGFRGKVELSTGARVSLDEQGEGLYEARTTPGAITSSKTIDLQIKGKTPDKTSLSESYSQKWTAPISDTLSLSSDPAVLTLPQDSSASLTLKLSKKDAKELDVLMRTSEGDIDNFTSLGDGVFNARYTPDAKKGFPHFTLITAMDPRAPGKVLGGYALAQQGKTTFPVTTIPNSNVIIEIGDRKFGPMQANANGRVNIPIIVPPNVEQATLISAIGGSTQKEPLDLRIPRTQRILFFPAPKTVPADSSLTIPLRVFAIDSLGKPDTNAKIVLSSDLGEVSDAVHLQDGIYGADFTPATKNELTNATITATIYEAGQKGIPDTIELTLIPTRSSRLKLTPEISVLSKSSSTFSNITKVYGPSDETLSGRDIYFSVSGGEAGPTKSLGNGDYSTRFTAGKTGPIEIIASVRGAPSQNALKSFAVDISQPRIANDGVSSMTVTVVALDAYGYPIPNTAFDIKNLSLDGNLPVKGKTDEFGFAQLTYTAGTETGMASFRASQGDISSDFAIFQLVEGRSKHLKSMEYSGSQEDIKLRRVWDQSIASLRIDREGMQNAPLIVENKSKGEITMIEVTLEPDRVVGGGVASISIKTLDDRGIAVTKGKPEVVASSGEVAKVQDMGGGIYTSSIKVPKDAVGEIHISVTDPKSGVSEFTPLKVLDAVVKPSTEPEVEAEPEEKKKKEPRVKKPREPSKAPMLRVTAAASVGNYSFQQMPETGDGVLYEKSITFNNQLDGSSPAQMGGVSITARGFYPDIPYLGAELKLHSDSYAVNIPEFNDPIVDWLTVGDIAFIGRYPQTFGDYDVHAGARAGLSTDHFLVYKQVDLGGGLLELSYEPLPLRSSFIGLDIGVESSLGVFGDFYYDLAFTGGGSYRKKTGMNVGYNVISGDTPLGGEAIYVQLGIRSTVRELEIEGSDGPAGSLRDGKNSFLFGAGWAY
jgi:hypothetical protein